MTEQDQANDGETDTTGADQRLARAVLGGDETAFSELYQRVAPAIYRMVRARIHDPELVKDIVQSTLFKGIESLPNYRGEGPLLAWFYGICRFEVLAYYKQKDRMPLSVELQPEATDVQDALTFLRGASETPEDRLRKNELATQLHWALDQLPTHYALALQWKYGDGLAVTEIAQRLDLTPKAAESVLTRARTAFKKTFDTAHLDTPPLS